MTVDDFIRIRPGKPIDGTFSHHVEVRDPANEHWHCVRACMDKADAVRVYDRLAILLNHVYRMRRR